MKKAALGSVIALLVLTGCGSPHSTIQNQGTGTQALTNETSGDEALGNATAANVTSTNAPSVNNDSSIQVSSQVSSQVAVDTRPVVWKDMPPLTAVKFTNAQVGWVGGKGVLLVTRDGGHTWTRVYEGKETVKDIDFANPMNGYVVFDDMVWKTTDGGVHWQSNPSFFDAMDMVSPTAAYGLQNGSVYAVNGNFKATRETPPVQVESINFVSDTTGYASGNAQVYQTKDGGRSWHKVFSAPFVNSGGPWKTRVQAAGNNVWLMVYGGVSGMSQVGYVVYHSKDAGSTWLPMLDEGYWAPAYPDVHPASTLGVGAQPGPFAMANSNSVLFIGWNVDDLVTTFSTDNGSTFVRHDGGTMDSPDMPDFFPGLQASFPTLQDGWLVGQKNGRGITIVTHDSGATWQTMH